MKSEALKKMKRMRKQIVLMLLFAIVIGISLGLPTVAADDIGIIQALVGENNTALDVLIMVTLLAIAPSILIMMTSFTRIIIVLSFLRSSMGLQQSPPTQVLIGLSLFLTLFIMRPVVEEINTVAYQPYKNEEMNSEEALKAAAVPVKKFMLGQTVDSDVDFFLRLSDRKAPADLMDLPLDIVVPAFVTSELKLAFTIGFYLYIPFLIIDIVVSSTLMSMGMIMLPPAMISMPFKIMLFVLVDGWQLIMGTLVRSFAK